MTEISHVTSGRIQSQSIEALLAIERKIEEVRPDDVRQNVNRGGLVAERDEFALLVFGRDGHGPPPPSQPRDQAVVDEQANGRIHRRFGKQSDQRPPFLADEQSFIGDERMRGEARGKNP